jgi:Fe-S oxidoreductase
MNEEESRGHIDTTLREENIIPFKEDELEVVKSIGHCINCGLCIQHCPVVAAVGLDRFSGPRSIAVELSRTPSEYWSTGDKVFLCTGCGTCREVCPKNVDVPEIVNMIRARIFKHRPDLVPKALHSVDKTLLEHGLAFEPWEDEEEKNDSRDMRLERLGLPFYPDRVKEKAEVMFYPGCQAEERTQEVREAAKVILEVFDIDYTLLDEMSCCGLPAILLGDDDTARDLATKLKKKVKASGVKRVVTTCAGCTSNLNYLADRDEWGVPVYHMLEFLAEEIGLDTLCEKLDESKEPMNVTIHSPCHLIRHTSRQIMDHTAQILLTLKDVTYVPSFGADSCCGGGGLVGYHSPDIASSVVRENLRAIEKTGASRVVTPCPLCTAQLENSLFKEGIPVDVDDMTVFIAQRLPAKKR